MNTQLNIVQLSSFKANIARAFASLKRNHGFVARRNFEDCTACGWAQITFKYGSPDNVVFYTQQDDESMEQGYVWLAWRGDGQAIVEALKAVGLGAEWDGSEDQRIRVTVEPKRLKNQIVSIRFSAWSTGEYQLDIHRKNGFHKVYETKHLSSIAFDWLGHCADNPRWLEDMRTSLSVYPMITYYFKDRTNEQ